MKLTAVLTDSHYYTLSAPDALLYFYQKTYCSENKILKNTSPSMHRKYHEHYYDYSSDIDSNEDVVAALGAAVIVCKHRRRQSLICKRLNWKVHVKQLLKEVQLTQM